MFQDNTSQQPALEDLTPATVVIAICFVGLVGYFIGDHYFAASEFYASDPPYLYLVGAGVAGAVVVYTSLKWIEPMRKNCVQYALLTGLGFGMAAYPFMPRLNVLTDTRGLQSFVYKMDEEHVWRSDIAGLPKLDLYSEYSDWWRQFKPGDSYTFELRRGGLGFWQINMTEIYRSQQAFYGCEGTFECFFN